jgi:poly(hydroxyalkanoate) depolymerase family esterase
MLGLLGPMATSLADYRRQWEELLLPAPSYLDAQPSRLVEVTGFEPAPGNLRMLSYLPADLPPGAPLVVVLHGCTQTAAAYDHGTGWSALADRLGFALLLPEQQRVNNPNSCFTWFAPEDSERGRGEPLSIRHMIERMIFDHGLDRRRVYISGLSAGGAMTSVMLATYPELFAGGAILAGLPYRCAVDLPQALRCMAEGQSRPAADWGDLVRAASPHRGPWPRVSVWHGATDSTVRPLNAEEIVKQWTDVHGLGEAPSVVGNVHGCPHRVWRDDAGQAVVEAYLVPGMGHGVPVHPGDDGAEDRGGTVAPFMVDAGIWSTWHIARFWRLAKPGLA